MNDFTLKTRTPSMYLKQYPKLSVFLREPERGNTQGVYRKFESEDGAIWTRVSMLTPTVVFSAKQKQFFNRLTKNLPCNANYKI